MRALLAAKGLVIGLRRWMMLRPGVQVPRVHGCGRPLALSQINQLHVRVRAVHPQLTAREVQALWAIGTTFRLPDERVPIYDHGTSRERESRVPMDRSTHRPSQMGQTTASQQRLQTLQHQQEAHSPVSPQSRSPPGVVSAPQSLPEHVLQVSPNHRPVSPRPATNGDPFTLSHANLLSQLSHHLRLQPNVIPPIDPHIPLLPFVGAPGQPHPQTLPGPRGLSVPLLDPTHGLHIPQHPPPPPPWPPHMSHQQVGGGGAVQFQQPMLPRMASSPPLGHNGANAPLLNTGAGGHDLPAPPPPQQHVRQLQHGQPHQQPVAEHDELTRPTSGRSSATSPLLEDPSS